MAVVKWIRSAKLTSFMDAYHAPYVTKNHYWTGLLLLARVVLYLTAAINVSGEPRFNLLAIFLSSLVAYFSINLVGTSKDSSSS